MGGSYDGLWSTEVMAAENCVNGSMLEFMHGLDTEEGMGWTAINTVQGMFVDLEDNLFKPYNVAPSVAQVEV